MSGFHKGRAAVKASRRTKIAVILTCCLAIGWELLLLALNLLSDPSVRYHLGLGEDHTFLVGDYSLRIRDDKSDPRYRLVELTKGKGSLWKKTDGDFRVYDFANEAYVNQDMKGLHVPDSFRPGHFEGVASVIAADLTADGAADAIVEDADWSHYPFRFWILSLGRDWTVSRAIEIGSLRLKPVDFDNDGVSELQTDCTIGSRYYKLCPRDYATLILKRSADRYIIATPEFYSQFSDSLSAMVSDYPKALASWRDSYWKTRAPLTQPDTYVGPPRELNQILLSYVCFGEGKTARALLDDLWPPQDRHKEVS